jgi:hypothetical protein
MPNFATKKQDDYYNHRASVLFASIQISRVSYKQSNSMSGHPPSSSRNSLTERHLERNQKDPEWPGSWGLPWKLLVSLQVFLRRSYGSLKAGFRKSSYFVYNLPG